MEKKPSIHQIVRNEMKEQWKEHEDEMNKMRSRRRYQFREIVREFRKMGFDVKEVSQFQYRFNDAIDIYPSNKRYHDLTKNVRGDIRGKSFNQFLREYFGLKI
jgi:DNA-binding ferritin-like protein (Dps family)